MKAPPNINKHFVFVTLLLLVLTFAFAPQQTQVQEIASYNGNPSCPMSAPGDTSIPGSCTTFVAQINETVLFGNNEDFNNPETYIWTVPSSDDGYGGVYLGYQFGKPQGGINEKGLAFDALALPEVSLDPHPELPSICQDSQPASIDDCPLSGQCVHQFIGRLYPVQGLY